MNKDDVLARLVKIIRTFHDEPVPVCNYMKDGDDEYRWLVTGDIVSDLIKSVTPADWHYPFITAVFPKESWNNDETEQEQDFYLNIDYRAVKDTGKQSYEDHIDLSDLYVYYVMNSGKTIFDMDCRIHWQIDYLRHSGQLEEVRHNSLNHCVNYSNRFIFRFPDDPLSDVPMKIVLGDIYDYVVSRPGGEEGIAKLLDKFENQVVPIYGFVHDERGRGACIGELKNKFFFSKERRDQAYWDWLGEDTGKEMSPYYTFFTSWIFK